jgi:hypothetical protein
MWRSRGNRSGDFEIVPIYWRMRSLRRLACAALLVAGCGGRQVQTGSGVVPVAAPAPVGTLGAANSAPTPFPGAFVMTPRETTLTPLLPEPPRPEPTAHYPSLEAARDAIEAMLRHAVSPADTAIRFSREAVTFDYRWAKGSARGLAIRVVVNDTTTCPHDQLMESLRAAGWVDDWNYSADGPDGGVMGLVCRRFLCVVEGRWDGGDPTDTTYVPPPGCEAKATVVPRRLDDVPGE